MNVSVPIDIDTALLIDTRPVLTFPENFPVVLDMQSRRTFFQNWYRGFGQVNRTPGLWQPEWVPISMLVYRPECSAGGLPSSAASGLLFSILWEDQSENFRHIIDFRKFAHPGAYDINWFTKVVV